MSTSPPVHIIPDKYDLFSAGIAYGANMWLKGSPAQGGMEQLVSIIVAKNVAERTAMTDRPEGSTIKEVDIWTGVVRAGWSAFQKRSNQAILEDGAKGIVCNVVARPLADAIIPEAL